MKKECWFHDWEVVERIGESALNSKVESDISGNPFYLEFECDYPYYIKKVCLKCEKIEDNITPEIERIKTSYYNSNDRANKAKQIIKDKIK